jgi:hypothetical protein
VIPDRRTESGAVHSPVGRSTLEAIISAAPFPTSHPPAVNRLVAGSNPARDLQANQGTARTSFWATSGATRMAPPRPRRRRAGYRTGCSGMVTVPRWKASSFWIILLVVSGRTDDRPIRHASRLGAAAAALVIASRRKFRFLAPTILSAATPWRDRFEIRHIAIRILAAQPAIAVSRLPFLVLGGVSTFPRVSCEKPGLWRGILGVSRPGRESRGESLLDEFSISEIWIGSRPETGCVSAETGSNPLADGPAAGLEVADGRQRSPRCCAGLRVHE